jgi:hypothetical protein
MWVRSPITEEGSAKPTNQCATSLQSAIALTGRPIILLVKLVQVVERSDLILGLKPFQTQIVHHMNELWP